LNAENEYEAIRTQATVLYSFRNGKIIAKTKPSETSITLNEGNEAVNFKR